MSLSVFLRRAAIALLQPCAVWPERPRPRRDARAGAFRAPWGAFRALSGVFSARTGVPRQRG